MSRTRSASTGRSYGRARVLKAWGLPRSTFYQRRRLHASPRLPARRGPKTGYTDEQLVGEIRRTIQASPFHGEGHRKVWARLRLAGVRTSLRRVLRLMRQHQLLALQREREPVEPRRHEGTILAERFNRMGGIDAKADLALRGRDVALLKARLLPYLLPRHPCSQTWHAVRGAGAGASSRARTIRGLLGRHRRPCKTAL